MSLMVICRVKETTFSFYTENHVPEVGDTIESANGVFFKVEERVWDINAEHNISNHVVLFLKEVTR